MKRKAKIAATLGPASDRPGVLIRMVEAGLDVARLNFSHGLPDDHRRRVERLRRIERRSGRPVALLADLQGPRFRVGTLPGGAVELIRGAEVVLEGGRKTAAAGRIPVSYAALGKDTHAGDLVLMDDGNLALRVVAVRGDRVRCVVERGGTLSDHKGINLPGGALSAPALTRKDRRDLELAVEFGADWLAISFVRRPADVVSARRLLRRAGSEIPVMAKIERPEAVDNLDAILEVSDGLLVARGDLGVELAPEKVPVLQKQIIEAANAAGKPVMTATQMLESMRHSVRPTRAEASDVANAVFDGSGCLLLTAETAVGKHPVKAVAMMVRIISEAEASGRVHYAAVPEGVLPVPETTALAAARAAVLVGARYLAAFTISGGTAAMVARFRPEIPILVFTPRPEIRRRLAMYWGIETHAMPELTTTRELIRHLDRKLIRSGLVDRGDHVVVLSGYPIGIAGTTNLMNIHRVGQAVEGGARRRARKNRG